MVAHLTFQVVLAILWCLLVGHFSGATFVVGLAVGGLTMFPLRRMTGAEPFFHKLRVLVRLTLFFLYELVLANLQVAWVILRPRLEVRSAFIRLPIELRSDGAITALANMISLTPGTISVDVAADRRSLLVHCLNVDDVAAIKRTIKERFEAQLRELEKP